MNKKIIISLLFICVFIAIGIAAPPPPPAGGPICWPPPCVPIDGGISLLIAAGAIYGGKKLYSKSQRQKPQL